MLGAAVGAHLLSKAHQAGDATPRTPAENRQQPRRRITALGRLEPGQGVIDINAGVDSIIDRLEVREGQFVKAGQVLAYLNSHDEFAALQEQASIQLRQAHQLLEAAEAGGKALIEKAKLVLKRVDDVVPHELAV